MALSKKGSRAIVVGGDSYRWAVSEDSGYSVLVAQNAEGSGQKLEVTVEWQDTDAGSGPPPITPAMVASVVEAALAQGWDTDARAKGAFARRLQSDGTLVATSAM
jgi:hypothetical protein